jgi:hypothetical protein
MVYFMFLHCIIMKLSMGGVYIVSFRSNQVRGIQDCVEITHEAQDGPTTQPTSSPMWWVLFLPRRVPHGLLLFQFLYFPKKWRGKKFGSIWRPEGP